VTVDLQDQNSALRAEVRRLEQKNRDLNESLNAYCVQLDELCRERSELRRQLALSGAPA